jgi:hypothetical protein
MSPLRRGTGRDGLVDSIVEHAQKDGDRSVVHSEEQGTERDRNTPFKPQNLDRELISVLFAHKKIALACRAIISRLVSLIISVWRSIDRSHYRVLSIDTFWRSDLSTGHSNKGSFYPI